MHAEGYPKFNQAAYTALWKELDAKDPAKGFGKAGDYKNTWVWFDSWLARVRAHCQENASKYVTAVSVRFWETLPLARTTAMRRKAAIW
ncbi:hypothetical protein [Mesorhizobium sp. LjNodule214]|uniref:hypothetical protein n=1 Tax=Mesorhizobium sp. LjNodule214 TaxID=3342252 RepID=UPI003ECE6EA2